VTKTCHWDPANHPSNEGLESGGRKPSLQGRLRFQTAKGLRGVPFKTAKALLLLPIRRAGRQLHWRSTGPKSSAAAWTVIPAHGLSWFARSIGVSTGFATTYRQPGRRRGPDPRRFLKIYSNLASFDMGRGSLQVWIATMTRNLLVDNFRRNRNQRATSSLDDGWSLPKSLKPIDRLTARGASPHEMAAKNELAKMVQEALARVSVDLREAVILRDLQDMDTRRSPVCWAFPKERSNPDQQRPRGTSEAAGT